MSRKIGRLTTALVREKGVCVGGEAYIGSTTGSIAPGGNESRGTRGERRGEKRGEEYGEDRREGNRRMSGGEGEIAENGGARTTMVRHWPGYK